MFRDANTRGLIAYERANLHQGKSVANPGRAWFVHRRQSSSRKLQVARGRLFAPLHVPKTITSHDLSNGWTGRGMREFRVGPIIENQCPIYRFAGLSGHLNCTCPFISSRLFVRFKFLIEIFNMFPYYCFHKVANKKIARVLWTN